MAGKPIVLRLVTPEQAEMATEVKEKGKRPIDMDVAESCDSIALWRLQHDPQAGYKVKSGELYTPEEAAGLLRVDVASVRRWCRAGRLASFKCVGGWRVQGSTLLKLIAGND